ncbi:MAG: hypothetical protein HYV67_02430 [Candidatus Taylorbacteria bacterium]|nr:hypothetical protein [Candidatus Taylorbacteria bacterium]
MKIFWRLTFLLLLAPSFAAAFTFNQNLRPGSAGAAVLELQRFLNQDSDTRVSEEGPGSPGNETSFFGRATWRAVVKFQEKYRSEILLPAGLYQGTGFVGPLTRKKITFLSQTAEVVENSAVASPPASNREASRTGGGQVLATSSLDQVQFDQKAFFQALDNVGAEQGYGRDQLTTIKDAAAKDIALQKPEKRFVEEFQKSGVPIHGVQSYKGGENFSAFLNTVLKFFIGEKAYAFGTPFGGRVLFPFYCTCSGNWLVTITPTAPTYVVLLTYYMGTQMYMGYNLPFTLNVLGEYTSGSQCQIYIGYGCTSIPSEGQIGATTGSSLF